MLRSPRQLSSKVIYFELLRFIIDGKLFQNVVANERQKASKEALLAAALSLEYSVYELDYEGYESVFESPSAFD